MTAIHRQPIVAMVVVCASAAAAYLLPRPVRSLSPNTGSVPTVSRARLHSGTKVTFWHAPRFASPQDFPWVSPYGSTVVIILNRTGEMAAPRLSSRSGRPLLILQDAVAIPPKQWGPPFRFQAMLSREVPSGTLLCDPQVAELGLADSRFNPSPPGSEATRSLRRITMKVH